MHCIFKHHIVSLDERFRTLYQGEAARPSAVALPTSMWRCYGNLLRVAGSIAKVLLAHACEQLCLQVVNRPLGADDQDSRQQSLTVLLNSS